MCMCISITSNQTLLKVLLEKGESTEMYQWVLFVNTKLLWRATLIKITTSKHPLKYFDYKMQYSIHQTVHQ